MTTASLEMPIARAERPGTRLVAGLRTRVPGVRSEPVQIKWVSEMAKNGMGKRYKTPG